MFTSDFKSFKGFLKDLKGFTSLGVFFLTMWIYLLFFFHGLSAMDLEDLPFLIIAVFLFVFIFYWLPLFIIFLLYPRAHAILISPYLSFAFLLGIYFTYRFLVDLMPAVFCDQYLFGPGPDILHTECSSFDPKIIILRFAVLLAFTFLLANLDRVLPFKFITKYFKNQLRV